MKNRNWGQVLLLLVTIFGVVALPSARQRGPESTSITITVSPDILAAIDRVADQQAITVEPQAARRAAVVLRAVEVRLAPLLASMREEQAVETALAVRQLTAAKCAKIRAAIGEDLPGCGGGR